MSDPEDLDRHCETCTCVVEVVPQLPSLVDEAVRSLNNLTIAVSKSDSDVFTPAFREALRDADQFINSWQDDLREGLAQ